MWRCIHDTFAYCKKEPDGAANAKMEDRVAKINGVDTIVEISLGIGATCSLSPKTCKKYVAWSQLIPKGTAPDAMIHTTIVADSKVQADKGKQEGLL